MTYETGPGPRQPEGGDAPHRSTERSPLALAGLGVQFLVSLLLFVYGGAWMDARYGTSPLFLLVGLLLGGGGSFYLGYRRLTRPYRGTDT